MAFSSPFFFAALARFVSIIKTRDGRIHRMREYMDTQRGFRCIFGD